MDNDEEAESEKKKLASSTSTTRCTSKALDLGPFADTVFKVRLSQYRELDSCIHFLEKKPACLVINLFQNALFFNASRFAPSLLQRSFLYNMVIDREVLPLEHFLFQGFPVPKFVKPELAKFFPFPTLVDLSYTDSKDKLTCSQMRSLTGIGFCWPAAGAMMMMALSTSTLKMDEVFPESTSKQEVYFEMEAARASSSSA